MATLMARIGLIIVGTFAVIMSGCASEEPLSPGKIDLADTAWVLEAYGEPGNLKPALPDNQPAISFDGENEVSGFTGCNWFGGDYATSPDGTIEFGMLHQTEMACGEPGVMEQEAAFMDALRLAQRYEYVDAQLHISGEGGALVFLRG